MKASHKVSPVFVLSLPRAGSTLLQRMLAAHSAVATASEPWLLLPHLSSLRRSGVYADYSQRSSSAAIAEFIQTLPRGRADYCAELESMATSLYSLASAEDARYFVDKTPRYHTVLDELFETFVDAKFIFLWRQPLAVVSSIVDTFCSGNWRVHGFKQDLYSGVESLLAAADRYSDRSISLRYEDLVTAPSESIARVCTYLDLETEPAMISGFSDVGLSGHFGDPTGVAAYHELSSYSLTKWHATLATPLRRSWSKSYLKWIGSDRLAFMGYNLDDLLVELRREPVRWSVSSDACNSAYGALWSLLETRQSADKLCSWKAGWRYVYPST